MSRRVLWLLFLGLFLQGSAVAQGLPTTLEFSFSNPGARSMGLGGAFVALADDATAAFANPAGLVQLTRPEISLEGRSWSYSNPFTEGGRLTGQPTGILLDNTPGLRTARSSSDVSSLSFLSVVYPRGPWALATYRHQLANFEQFTETQGLFAAGAGFPDDAVFPSQPPRVMDLRTSTDLGIVNYGAGVAYRPSDAISLGLGISYVEADLRLDSSLYVVEDPNLEESQFGPNPFLPDRRVASAIIDSQSSDWSVTLGILGQLSSRWSCAAFYRLGPDFDIRVVSLSGPGLVPTIPDGTVIEADSEVFPLPDVFGLGVAFKPLGALTVAFEWDRVRYSQIFEGDDTNRLDDADELHLGVEYVFIRATPIIAVRSGIWLDPDHRIRTVGDDVVERALLRGGDDELHYTVGLGFVFENFQIDLGVDLSELVDRVALSAIYNL
jgi:long-subunit fatty acid transport protein